MVAAQQPALNGNGKRQRNDIEEGKQKRLKAESDDRFRARVASQWKYYKNNWKVTGDDIVISREEFYEIAEGSRVCMVPIQPSPAEEHQNKQGHVLRYCQGNWELKHNGNSFSHPNTHAEGNAAPNIHAARNSNIVEQHEQPPFQPRSAIPPRRTQMSAHPGYSRTVDEAAICRVRSSSLRPSGHTCTAK